jgi:hypothetical protein
MSGSSGTCWKIPETRRCRGPPPPPPPPGFLYCAHFLYRFNSGFQGLWGFRVCGGLGFVSRVEVHDNVVASVVACDNSLPGAGAGVAPRAVAVQVAFCYILKPFFHLIGARIETRRLSVMGQGESTCTAPPCFAAPRGSCSPRRRRRGSYSSSASRPRPRPRRAAPRCSGTSCEFENPNFGNQEIT